MKERARFYTNLFTEHLKTYRQMAFVTGPRQVGKTTTCRGLGTSYLDWDNEDHREVILKGPKAVAAYAELDRLTKETPVIVLDELHKYNRWKTFLKGFFDTYEGQARIMVTGSSRLDVYRRGGDSLMGRYFLFRMHPFSVGEIVHTDLSKDIIRPPKPIAAMDWKSLWEHGGYPEPFTRRSAEFTRRWHNLRQTQLLKEDVRSLTRIQELDQLAMLGHLLTERSGGQIIYSTLARTIRVSENTVRSWIATLCSLHYGFLVRPWSKNISKALRKEPKWFLRDWSSVEDLGKRAETFCACHLLKAVQGWTDLGLGVFELHYVRDKQKKEVDFMVTRDGNPWFLVEAKYSDTSLSPSLEYFQTQTGCTHAFQVVLDIPYVDEDCFSSSKPIVVPAQTLLSQLL